MCDVRVLVADLNNFALYPTISVGYIVAACRQADMQTSVFSPLSVGVNGASRENHATRTWLLSAKANYLASGSRSRALRTLRQSAAMTVRMPLRRSMRRTIRAFEASVEANRPSIVLVSTYLAYHELTEAICQACARRGLPVIVGGPYFAQPLVAREWITIDGLTALVAGEVEVDLPEILRAVVRGEDASRYPGVLLPDSGAVCGFRGRIAPPLAELDVAPIPDYSDFPWSRYPQRIIPILTGRGCAWGACAFCSDVTSTAGRTFRSRDPKKALEEIRIQSERSGASLFVFTDLKLNSDLRMWSAIIENMQRVAPGSRWIGSVHVGARGENGLSEFELQSAADSGCVRLTTGLESGSQRMLDLMRKGTTSEAISEYLWAATRAGISTRCTMIAGYPGERTEDVALSERFLNDNADALERVSLNPFRFITGTPAHRAAEKKKFDDVRDVRPNHRLAVLDHHHVRTSEPAYRRAMMRLFDAVFEINRKPLLERARQFEGVM